MEQSLDITKIYNHAAETIKNAILKYCCPIKLEDGKKAWLER